MDVVAIVGTVGSVAAAFYAFLAWNSTKERHPFRLSPLSDGVIVVTRTSRIPAHPDGIGVTHHQQLMATDDRAEISGRVLKRYEFVALEPTGLHPDARGRDAGRALPLLATQERAP